MRAEEATKIAQYLTVHGVNRREWFYYPTYVGDDINYDENGWAVFMRRLKADTMVAVFENGQSSFRERNIMQDYYNRERKGNTK